MRNIFDQESDKNTVKAKKTNTNNSSNNIKDNSNDNERVQKSINKSNKFYRPKETKNTHLETFNDTIQTQVFEPRNLKSDRSNITYEERKVLTELKSMENTVVRIEVIGSKFALLTNEEFQKK